MTEDFFPKLTQFFNQFKKINYKKGETILRPEDNPPGVFYLAKGYVKLYTISTEAQELTLNIFKPGSYFSMMWAIGETPNTYFFETITPVEVRRAPKEELLQFLKKDPEALFELTKRILIGLNGILWVMEHLLFSNADAKVASIILVLAKRFGEKTGNGKIVIQLPLSHQDIASLAGLTRETTSIEIKKLERKGLISRQKRLLIIKNIEKLEEELLISGKEEPLAHTF